MTQQQSIDDSKARAYQWFKDHTAKLTRFSFASYLGELKYGEAIRWAHGNDSNYAVRFVLMGNYVIVTGDVGDAIYAFGCPATREFLISIDWHYFVSKCCASEEGRKFEMKIEGVRHPVPHLRAIAHFVGLNMALKQLAAR